MFSTLYNTLNVPKNPALDEITLGLSLAHTEYLKQQSLSNVESKVIVLMMVQPGERNFADQRSIHFELLSKYNIKCVRATFEECRENGEFDQSSGKFFFKQQQVSVVYYRVGYAPDDYTCEEDWKLRLDIENSLSIKCPSIQYHLAGQFVFTKVRSITYNSLILPLIISLLTVSSHIVRKIP